jgi:AcrR family transcriptional regulator
VARPALVHVATGPFAQHGYLVISLRDISGRRGVTVAALNYHLRSKSSLLDAVLAV